MVGAARAYAWLVHYPSCARSRRRPVHGWRHPDGADRLWSGVRRAPDDPLLHHADAHSETGSGRALAELERQGGSRWGRRERCSAEAPCPPSLLTVPLRFGLLAGRGAVAVFTCTCVALSLAASAWVYASCTGGRHTATPGPPPPVPTRPRAPTAVASRAGPPLHTQPSLCPRLVLALVACRVRAPRLGWTRVRRASPPARLPRRAPLLARARRAAIAAHAFGRIAAQAVEGYGRGYHARGLLGEATRRGDQACCMRVHCQARSPACCAPRRAAPRRPSPRGGPSPRGVGTLLRAASFIMLAQSTHQDPGS